MGFRFIFGQQSVVLTLVIISSLYNLGVSAFVFILPVYAGISPGWPGAIGLVVVGLGVGMLAASTWLAWNKHSDKQGRLRIVVSGMTIGSLAVCSLNLLETPLIGGGDRHHRGWQHGGPQSDHLGPLAGGDAGTSDRSRGHDLQRGLHGLGDGRDDRIRMGGRCGEDLLPASDSVSCCY